MPGTWPTVILLVVATVCGTACGQFRARTPGQYFDSAGVKIYYTDEGSGPPVILIHGLAANADANWRRPGTVDALTPHYRVITLDLRGHGLSDKPHAVEAYGTQMCEDVVRLMDHLNLPRAHVVGYSLGGFITLKLATLHPNRLLSIGVCGAGWDPPEASPTFNFLARRGERGLEAGDDAEPGALAGRRNDPEALAAVSAASPALKVSEAEIRALTMPICVVAGDRDPERFAAQRLRDMAAHVTFTSIPGAGHIQAVARPELRDALRGFLDRQPR